MDIQTPRNQILQAMSDGSLGAIDDNSLKSMLDAAKVSTSTYDLVMTQHYVDQVYATVNMLSSKRKQEWEQQKDARHTAMFQRAGLNEDEALAALQARLNGDPSAMMKIKEDYFYGRL